MGWWRPTTPKARCSAFPSSGAGRRAWRGGLARGPPHGGALHLRGGGLGAGGRHHSSNAAVLCASKLNFRELRQSEVRRTRHRRTSGSVKVHSWVTAFGQQGTEAERGRSVNFGDS